MLQNTNVQVGWMRTHVQLYQTHAATEYVTLMNYATHVNLIVDAEELRSVMHKQASVIHQQEFVKHLVAQAHS
jgi:hypothetical protein